jgi:trimeric autotransporter adhesin
VKILFGVVLFLAAISASAQGWPRQTFAVQNNAGYLKVIPNAPITLCVYNSQKQCNTPVTIYSNSTLTTAISYPFYANANGYFSYYATPGNYIEQQCVPAGGCFTYSLTFPGTSGGSGTVSSVSATGTGGISATCAANCTTTPSISVGPDSSHLIPVNTGSSSLFLNQAGTYTAPSGGVSSFNTRTNAVTLEASDIAAAVAGLTGCSTSGYFYSPASSSCSPAASGVTFQTNGTNNSTQTGLNIVCVGLAVCTNSAGDTVQISAGGAALPTTNLIGYYTPYKLGGTTIPDNSGNGNTLTFCPCSGSGTAPTSTNIGLNFPITASFPSNGANVSTAAVEEPTALNATQAFVMSVYITPQGSGVSTTGVIGAGINPGVANALMISSDISPFYDGLGWAAGAIGGNGTNQVWSPFIFNGAVPPQYPISGYHILGFDLGSTSGSCSTFDTLYIDGQPMTGTYASTSCSFGLQTGSNHYYIGPSPSWISVQYSFPGTLYSLAQYSAPLGASGQQLVAQALLSENYARGVPTTSTPGLSSAATLFCAGDSITYGLGITTPYCGLLNLTNSPTTRILIEAVSGTTIDAMVGSEPNRIIPQCYSPAGQCIVSLFEGTNNFLSYTADTPLSVFGKLTQHITLLRNAGAKVGAITMLSRLATGGNPQATACSGSYDTCKDAYNPLIVNSGLTTGLTFIVDVANFPGLGADGAYANPTSPCNATHTLTPIVGGSSACFQGDGTHPTQAGAQAIADMYSNVFNHVFGNTRLNPHLLATSGTTYPLIPSDGGLTLTGSTAQTLTMVDCSGQTGLDYFINNTSSATATLNELVAAQPIKGGSSITIAAGAAVDIFAQANSYVTSGCQWVVH